MGWQLYSNRQQYKNKIYLLRLKYIGFWKHREGTNPYTVIESSGKEGKKIRHLIGQ